MLIIRLQRTGKKNAADFRVVLAQKTASAKKKFVEVLGSYNPRLKVFAIKSEERLKYWIAQKVEISPTVHNLLVSKNLLDAKKVRAFNTPKKPAEPAAATPAADVKAEASPAAEPASASAEATADKPVEMPVAEPAAAEAPAPAEPPAE